jgi:uncharacterized membrane protein
MARSAARLPAIDWMRGLVMVLMTIDHAAGAFNAGHLMTDGLMLYKAGMPLPFWQFVTRWITHLCAPTFVFLAGASLALSVEKRVARGEPGWSIDRFILARGLVIAALDPLWMSWIFIPGLILLQVLYAIGVSMMVMVVLRRLPGRWLLAAGVVLLVACEPLVGVVMAVLGRPNLPAALLLTGGQFSGMVVAYPVLPWLSIMMIGWGFGRWLRDADSHQVSGRLLAIGTAALVLFVAVRGFNGPGNMGLLREDHSLVQWLHVSKYPPGLSFATLELGLMAILLGLFFRRAASDTSSPHVLRPLLVFGQTALFFYLLHAHLLTLAARVLGLSHRGGLLETYVATLGALLVLYPLCVMYGNYKRVHPEGWTRFI